MKKFVFVLMPFSSEFDDIYKLGIKSACEFENVYCERVDEQYYEGSMLDRIYNQINKADYLVADTTNKNPNVFYEIGYAHALEKKVILITQDGNDIPFDMKHFMHILYEKDKISALKESLQKKIQWYLNNDDDRMSNNIGCCPDIYLNEIKLEEGKHNTVSMPLEFLPNDNHLGYSSLLSILLNNPSETFEDIHLQHMSIWFPQSFTIKNDQTAKNVPGELKVIDRHFVDPLYPHGWWSEDIIIEFDLNNPPKQTHDGIIMIYLNKNVVIKHNFSIIFSGDIYKSKNIPENVTLFDLFGVSSAEALQIEKRWQESQIHKTMAAPLGLKSNSEVVALDLHEKYHGPHGLVAGTTGSGKSEILQSYILSMAVLFHPYEVGFVIIDFKGGGMVNQFKDLPHLIGSITSIGRHETNRSLLLIKAELRKRQELFAQHNVNHINTYIQLFKKNEAKTPLPHLILVVDEFAELKMDQPEFMKELVSIARIGRSLGVHLILTTQKPSGVVDAQIWSNSKFKLCLKVQNKEDSNEVLRSPLAAEIKEPGRAYLQVGNNEIFELFQSAYSGAPSSNDYKGQKSYVDAETQLKAIVNYVAQYCKKNNIERLPGICPPPLPELIPFTHATKVESAQSGIQVVLGVYDDLNNQLQKQMQMDLLSGNIFIVGASQYGKTALLQLLIRDLAERYSPEEVSIYILDFASTTLKVFDLLKHVGGVVTAVDVVKLKIFFHMIIREIAFRKDKFSKLNLTSFASYKEAGYKDLPCIVVMLDNLTMFRELFEDFDETFLRVCREGLTVGISMIVTTSQIRGIGYNYLSSFAHPIALHCNQKDEYNALFERCKLEPLSIPGRAVVAIDKEMFEMQTYLAFEGKREIDRVNNIRGFVTQMQEKYTTQQAHRIPEIPHALTSETMWKNYEMQPYCVGIGMDYNTVDVVALNLLKLGYLAISGREKSGRTNFVYYMLRCLQQQNLPAEVHIVDGYDRQLEPLAGQPLVKDYVVDIDVLPELMLALDTECIRRKKLLQQGGRKALVEVPLLFVTIAHPHFFEIDGLGKDEIETCKKLMKIGKEIKLFFLFAELKNAPIPYGASDVLKAVKEGKNVLFFDDLNAFKMWDVAMAESRKQTKPLELGDAFFLNENETVVRIKTPLLV